MNVINTIVKDEEPKIDGVSFGELCASTTKYTVKIGLNHPVHQSVFFLEAETDIDASNGSSLSHKGHAIVIFKNHDIRPTEDEFYLLAEQCRAMLNESLNKKTLLTDLKENLLAEFDKREIYEAFKTALMG